MSDFIPEVIMDENENSGSDNESDKEETIDEITDIKTPEKNKIQEEDIFVDKKKKLEIKEVIEEIPQTPRPAPKKERKKRVMTEEHKQKLALAREKALAKRRENAARKKEIKQLEKEAEEQKYQELKEKVRPQKKKEVIKETSGFIHEEEKRVEKELKKVNKNYTQEDLDQAVLNGIMKYDSLRKERKKKKQEQKDLNKHEEQVKKKIQQVINQPVQDYNFFDNCY